jgi:hypothetical protein
VTQLNPHLDATGLDALLAGSSPKIATDLSQESANALLRRLIGLGVHARKEEQAGFIPREAMPGAAGTMPAPQAAKRNQSSPSGSGSRIDQFKRLSLGKKTLVVFLGLIVLGAVTRILEPTRPQPTMTNPAHTQLQALPRAGQAIALGRVVESSGDRCTARDAAFKGLNRSRGTAYWRVDCAEGRKSYLIGIESDAAGTTTVLDCAVSSALEKMAGKSGGKDLCFDSW